MYVLQHNDHQFSLSLKTSSIKPIISNFITGIAAMLLLSVGTGCAFTRVDRTKNIVYQQATNDPSLPAQQLNVFAPHKRKENKDVLIFIHGGNWNAGKKSLYNFLGNRMARKDIVTVIIDYPLSPAATYKEMAIASANAVKWVKENIYKYGGDPQRIFISGHSAGGHLASLVSVDDAYFGKGNNPIKGTILIDAAGLDMYAYLSEGVYEPRPSYYTTFTHDAEKWKDASPMYHLHKDMPPMLIYTGSKTYRSIYESSINFTNAVKQYQPGTALHIINGKKHVAMITQFFFTGNKRYKEIKDFMKSVK